MAQLTPLGDIVNVHCRCDDHVARFRTRKKLDGVRSSQLDALVARVIEDKSRSCEPLKLECRQVLVDTEAGYTPGLDELLASIRSV